MQTTPDQQQPEDALYPIRTVASLTGINPVTLRAWERRYGLLNPQRTPKGHRLYTRQDIDLIREAIVLLKTGIPISQVRNHLGRHDEPQPSTALSSMQEQTDTWKQYAERMLQAVERFDETALDTTYNEVLALYPVDLVTLNLIQPLLKQLGLQWDKRPGGIAEEHFFSTYLRNRLGARFQHLSTRRHKPRIVAACAPGEQHEIGLLLFCLITAAYGYSILILGADTPLDQIAHAASVGRCDAIVLSVTTSPPPDVLDSQLKKLVNKAGIPVMVGGRASSKAEKIIGEAGAITLGEDMHSAAERLRVILGPMRG